MPLGVVTRWDGSRGFGFVKLRSDDKSERKDVYVNASIIDGGSLIEGEVVEVTYKERGDTGKFAAETCTGDGVRNGSTKGMVVRWHDAKGYGFLRAHNTEEETFVHRSDVGEGCQLKLGGVVTYDTVDKNHESGLCAINVSGPGIIKDGDSLKELLYDLGIDADEDFLQELAEHGVHSTSDILNCNYYNLQSFGFGDAAADRVAENNRYFQTLAYSGKPAPSSTKKLEEGQDRARVLNFSPSSHYGLAVILTGGKTPKRGDDASIVYIPQAVINGGSLAVGEIVLVKTEDSKHKSGRRLATEVTGYGVREAGALTGEVVMWDSEGAFGFIRGNTKKDVEDVYFARFPIAAKDKDRPNDDPRYKLALRQGETVTFDSADRGGKKKHAININGEGVTTEEDLARNPPHSGHDFSHHYPTWFKGGKGGKGSGIISARGQRGGAGGGYSAGGYSAPIGGKGKGRGNVISAGRGVGLGAPPTAQKRGSMPPSQYSAPPTASRAPVAAGRGLPVGRGAPVGGGLPVGRGAPTPAKTPPTAAGRGFPAGSAGRGFPAAGVAANGGGAAAAGRGLPVGRGAPVGGAGAKGGKGRGIPAGRGY